MGRSKKKKTVLPVEEEKVEEPENEPAPEESKTAEWLIQNTMYGLGVMCSNCHSRNPMTEKTLAANLVRNKYCYNCGYEMIIRDI